MATRGHVPAAMTGQPTKKTKTAESTACRVTLPDDLILEVLLRLPARSLARLRCTCRSWNAEISSRSFQDRHHTLAAAKLAFLPSVPKHYFFQEIVLGWARSTQRLDRCVLCPRVIGSKPCCGVVLVLRPCTGYFVCNPSTGEILRLPRSHDIHMHDVAGIGFHAPTGEFKVVQVSIGFGLGKPHGTVLTIGDARGWRVPAASNQASFADFTDDARIERHVLPVFADGCLHWSFVTHDVYIDKPHGILCFSLADESFRRVPQPPFSTLDLVPFDGDGHPQHKEQLWRSHGRRSGSGEGVAVPVGKTLAELDGRLCMMRDVRHRSDVGGCLFEIWKLQDYETGTWSLDYRIDLTRRYMAERLTTPWLVVPLRYLDGGSPREKRKLLLATTAQEAHVYDPGAGTLRTVVSIPRGGNAASYSDSSIRLVLYQESLVRFSGMKQGKGEIEFVQF